MIKELIRCTACNQVIPNYGGFELARANSLPGVEWNNADLARVKDFLTAHRGHPMEKLFIKADSCISEKPSYEPLRVTYFFAESGERKFLVRRTKTALDQPAFYEIFPGRLQILNKSLKIQEDDLGKQIAADKGLSLVPKERCRDSSKPSERKWRASLWRRWGRWPSRSRRERPPSRPTGV